MFKVCVSLQLLAPLLLFDGAKVRVFFILCNRLRRKSAEVRRFFDPSNLPRGEATYPMDNKYAQ